MDEFLTKLDVNSETKIDELPEKFAHVLSYINIDHDSNPDGAKVRIILRSALFLYGNLGIHGQKLEQKLKECQLIPKNELNSLLEKFHADTLLIDVCQKLLTTTTGPNFILEIQDFCSEFLDSNQYAQILSTVRKLRESQITNDQVAKEAKFLINTTFQLETVNEIEVAIERIIDKVDFSILAWIINFDQPLTYFAMKCNYIQSEICSKLETGLVSENFIASMYETSALSEDGASMYLKCLQNQMFANSLMTFFINYLSSIEAITSSNEHSKYKKYDLRHISFLIAGVLSRKSTKRIEFHRKLAAMSININVLLSISHLNFIYCF